MRQILLPLLVSLVSVVLGFAISLVLAIIVGNIFGTGRGVVVFFVSFLALTAFWAAKFKVQSGND